MSQKTVPIIELIALILSCHLVTVKFISLNFHNWWPQNKGRITASRLHEVNQKVQTFYKNGLKPLKCRIKPLLSIVEPKELKNVESLEWRKKNEKMQQKVL